jgi:hypothetical protein
VTLTHSARPDRWSDKWSNEVVLTTRSNAASGCGRFSATPTENLSCWSSDVASATSIIAGHRVEADQFGRVRIPTGQQPHEIAGPVPDVEDVVRRRLSRRGRGHRAIDDLVVQPVVVAWRAFVECGDIACRATSRSRVWNPQCKVGVRSTSDRGSDASEAK